MKQKLSKFIQPAIAVLALALVVSVASAWTPPTGTFPTGNVPAPVNTGNVAQTKDANFSVNGSLAATGNVMGVNGFFAGLANAMKGRFGCVLFCSDLQSGDIFKAGSYNAGNFSKGIAVSSAGALSVIDGNQAAGKVLTSDAVGNASWADGTPPALTTTTDGLIKYEKRIQPTGSAASVYCGGNDKSDDANWIVIGGGGYCQYGTQISRPVTDRNNSAIPNGESFSAIGWQVDCLDRDNPSTAIRDGGFNTQTGIAHAEVICMKKQNLVTGFGTAPTPPGATWANRPGPSGTVGQSCAAWMNSGPTYSSYRTYVTNNKPAIAGQPYSIPDTCAVRRTGGSPDCKAGQPLPGEANYGPVTSCTKTATVSGQTVNYLYTTQYLP